MDYINDNLPEVSSVGEALDALASEYGLEAGAIAMVRLNEAFNLPTSSQPMPFTLTDEESDPTILEHDKSDRSNILIKKDGKYLISYFLPLKYETGSSTFKIFFKVVNKGQKLIGSRRKIKNWDANQILHTFAAELKTGDCLQLVVKDTTGNHVILDEYDPEDDEDQENNGATFHIIQLKQKGAQGECGATGPTGPQGIPGEPGPAGGPTGPIGPPSPGSSGAVVQIRKTAEYLLPASYVDVPFDALDIENQPDILQKDPLNADRILIKKTAYYQIQYNFSTKFVGLKKLSARVRSNDTIVLDGSVQTIRESHNIEAVGADFFALLNAGDWVSLQILHSKPPFTDGEDDGDVDDDDLNNHWSKADKWGANQPRTIPDIVFVINEAGGEKGATGPTGEGATGPTGPKGDKGDKGDIGDQGQDGATGPKGDKGDKGDIGDQGQDGATGPKGDTGGQGQDGEPGVTGPQGVPGPRGGQGATGSQGIQGITGETGPKGEDGDFGGACFDYNFLTRIDTDDPGNGNLNVNDILTAANKLVISGTDNNSDDISNFLKAIDDSTSQIKGHFTISKKNDPSTRVLYTIIGELIDNTTYFVVPCNYIDGDGDGIFSNGEDIVICFARTGDKGDTGEAGEQGPPGPTGETEPGLYWKHLTFMGG